MADAAVNTWSSACPKKAWGGFSALRAANKGSPYNVSLLHSDLRVKLVNQRTLHRITVAGAALLIASAGQAAMYVDRAEVTFKAGEPARQDIVITNPDAEPLYVKVEVSEIFNAGTAAEERRISREAEDINLLATPNKLVIQPGQQKNVRLVNLAGHGESERVYRVNVTPVVGKVEVPAGASGMQVKVLVAYDLLAVVAPQKPQPALAALREGKSITFRNNGNTNMFLFNGVQCPTPEALPAECVTIHGKRLYPGNTWTVELPFDQPVDFSLSIVDTHEKRRFN